MVNIFKRVFFFLTFLLFVSCEVQELPNIQGEYNSIVTFAHSSDIFIDGEYGKVKNYNIHSKSSLPNQLKRVVFAAGEFNDNVRLYRFRDHYTTINGFTTIYYSIDTPLIFRVQGDVVTQVSEGQIYSQNIPSGEIIDSRILLGEIVQDLNAIFNQVELNLAFVEVPQTDSRSQLVIEPYQSSGSAALMRTLRLGTFNNNRTTVYYLANNIQAAVSSLSVTDRDHFLGTRDSRAILQEIMRRSYTHELFHALGLNHSEENGQEEIPLTHNYGGSRIYSNYSTWSMPSSLPRWPIMSSRMFPADLRAFFESSDRYNRNNALPNANELAALRRLNRVEPNISWLPTALLMCWASNSSGKSSALTVCKPKYVYRADARPPNIVFADGFSVSKQNQSSLSNIITGHSLEGSILTSGSVSDMISALDTDTFNQSSTIYIYKIRADHNTYRVLNSFDNHTEKQAFVNAFSPLFKIIKEPYYTYAQTNTIFTTPDIRYENIESAIAYKKENTQWLSQEEYYNDKYLLSNTQANSTIASPLTFEINTYKSASSDINKVVPYGFCSNVTGGEGYGVRCMAPYVKSLSQFGPYKTYCSAGGFILAGSITCKFSNYSNQEIGRFYGAFGGISPLGVGLNGEAYFSYPVSTLAHKEEDHGFELGLGGVYGVGGKLRIWRGSDHYSIDLSGGGAVLGGAVVGGQYGYFYK